MMFIYMYKYMDMYMYDMSVCTCMFVLISCSYRPSAGVPDDHGGGAGCQSGGAGDREHSS